MIGTVVNRCVMCGKSFEVAYEFRDSNFCCLDCMTAWKERYGGFREKGGKYVRTCPECLREFRTTVGNAVYCPDCAEARRIRYRAERAERERAWIPEDRECATCGAVFTAESPWAKICPECEGLKSTRLGAVRRCHDCGRPTTQYRCSACWAKLRRKLRAGDEEDGE